MGNVSDIALCHLESSHLNMPVPPELDASFLLHTDCTRSQLMASQPRSLREHIAEIVARECPEQNTMAESNTTMREWRYPESIMASLKA